MKINYLDLQAFGHFTGKSLDFSRSNASLNIVFGRNEAGKSTTMRALDCFFFGFGLKSPDAFVHSYKDLAVRAVLEVDSGRSLDLTRFKRNKNDLVNGDGQAVDPGLMNSLMSGLTRDMYTNMFGLDHQSLRQGAEQILKGGGHLGETLFAAASGITGLRLVLEDLRKKADELFKPRASSRPIWQGVQKISDLNRQLRELSVRPEEWRNLRNSLEKLQKDKQDVEARIRDLESSLHGHQRYYKARPHISAFHQLNAQLEELKSIPELSPDFTGKRVRILTTINRLTHDLEKLTRLENGLSRELGQIRVCDQTISFAGELERLFRQSPVIIAAREEISSLDPEISSLEGLANEKTRLLPETNLLDNPEILHPDPLRIKRIEAQAGELALLKDRLGQSQKEIRDSRRDLEFTAEQLSGLPFIPDAKKLEVLSRRMSMVPEILKRQSRSRTRIKKIRSQIEKGISSLGLWEGDAEKLAGLALPMRETIDSYDQEIAVTLQDMEFARKKISELQEYLAAKNSALSGLDPDQSIPDPDSLTRFRNLRDQSWSRIKSAWADNAQDKQEINEFALSPDFFRLADGFERNMTKADQTADVLLEKADQVAAKAGLERQIKDLEDKKQKLDSVLETGAQNYARIMEKWTSLWSGPGITPLSPREMAAWNSRVKDILHIREDLENEMLELENLHEQINELDCLARQTLTGEGFVLPPGADLSDLFVLVDDARDKALELADTQKGLSRDQKKLERTLDNILARQTGLHQELEDKKSFWAELLAGLNLDPAGDPGHILEEIRIRQEIYADFRQLEKLSGQKKALEKKCREFSNQAARLLRNMRYHENFEGRPEDIIIRLHARLKEEQKKADQRSDLKVRLEDTREKISEAAAELAVLEGEMKIICREGGAGHPDELPGIENKSALKKELKGKLEHTLANLREQSSGEDLEDFLTRAGGFDPDELQGIISGLETEKTEKTSRLEQLVKESLEVELHLRNMDGTSRVAGVEQQIQEQRSFLENNVEEYVRLDLAANILSAEIERYRTANQGPVLEKAGKIFREITLNSFCGVMADYDEKGDPVIRAVRNSGARLRVEDLSDGSRDQLFLALRLGGIYRYLDQNPPFPFLVDDILVHFDDERSKKTLSVLAGLSQKTQVLFFTHHRHLVELALQIPQNHMVKVHELS